MNVFMLRFGLAVGLAVLLVSASPEASTAAGFCTWGSGSAQCKQPAGLGVDESSGLVYVADSGNDRINVFSEAGLFESSFGSFGTGSGELSNPRRLAVDSSPTSQNFHDIYIADGTQRVQRFGATGVFESALAAGQVNRSNAPMAVDSSGDLYLLDSNGAESIVKVFPPNSLVFTASSVINTEPGVGIVVDSMANVYVLVGNEVRKYETTEPTATLLGSFEASNARALAIDVEDNLFIAQRAQGVGVITKRDSSGSIVKRFGYGEIEFPLEGIAVGATGDLFASEEYVGSETEGNKVVRIEQPPAGPLSCCLSVIPGNTKATLKGQVNPEGKSATYHFEYLTDAEYVANGNSFTGPNAPSSSPESGSIGSDFALHEAQAQIGCATPIDPPQPECLKPETDYHVRLVVTNADDEGEANASPEITFESKEPLEFGGVWSTNVGLDQAEIHGEVNPLGIPATVLFEYVDDAKYQASGFADAAIAPATPLGIGAGEEAVSASTALTGLEPGMIYHYRPSASNPFVEKVLGPERTFRTYPAARAAIPACPNDVFRVGISALLVDCRAYEMVSPIDKNGGDIKVLLNIINFPTRLDQSADDGNSFSYSAVPAFGKPESAPFVSQYLARRAASAWESEAINPPRESKPLTDQYVRLDAQYKIFSPDLSEGWLFQDANPPLGKCAPEGFINLYRRDNATGSYEALIPSGPPANDPLEGYRLELQGASADGTHTVFRANSKLTSDAANSSGQNAYQVYEHIRDGEGGCGQLRLVSFKPNGQPSTQAASVGTPGGPAEYRESTVVRAVSADARRVFFTLENNAASRGPLYVRVNADQPQSPVAGGKCTNAALGCTLEVSTATTQFWTAATDGSPAIYSTAGSLFEYDVDKALAGQPASTLIAGGAQGVVGASADASRIYFVSTQQIEGEGVAGKPNLYLCEPASAAPEKYRLVATLGIQDTEGLRYWGFAVGNSAPSRNGTRLSADGSRLAFVSTGNPTGYDNLDADTGEPSLELYLYDIESEAVRCISCNPSGSRPEGREFIEGLASLQVSAMMAPAENQSFAPRALSSDGSRLFFESFESLLPRDENEAEDVYEWQRAANAAECAAKGAELYVPSSAGCLSLISSGEAGATDSELADASPDGSDVFIRTASSLVPQDPGQVDIYDVREGGGFPAPPTPKEGGCENEKCLPPPLSSSPGTAIATQGQSSGNVPAPKPCPKGKVRKGGKCKPKPCPKGKVRKGKKCKPKHHKQRATKNKKGGHK